MSVKIKRAYEKPQSTDGYRVLVDRIWPRGVKKQDLQLDEWIKELAPSDALRKWFAHDAEKWDGFRRKYRHELKSASHQLESLRQRAADHTVTLVYGAKDTEHNQAVVLKEVIETRM